MMCWCVWCTVYDVCLQVEMWRAVVCAAVLLHVAMVTAEDQKGKVHVANDIGSVYTRLGCPLAL